MKQSRIEACLQHIRGIMEICRPDKPLRIEYMKISEDNINSFTEWERRYHHILTGDEYFIIREEDGQLLYARNVSGDSILTALWELMDLIAKKF